MTVPVHLVRTHAQALEASGGSAFVRYDVPSPLEGDGYALAGALAIPRRTHTRRLGLLVLGPPADVDLLFGTLLEEGCSTPRSGPSPCSGARSTPWPGTCR